MKFRNQTVQLLEPHKAPSPLSGSTDSYKAGSRKRRLPPIVLARLGQSANTSFLTYKLMLTGLNTDLTALIGVGWAPTTGSGDILPAMTAVFPLQYPTVPGSVQLVPKMETPGAPLFLRPVFQNPAAVDNSNHPLGMDIPFGWSFESEGVDSVLIVVSIDANQYLAPPVPPVGSLLVCDVTVEYTGESLSIASQPDREAIIYALGQVKISGSNNPDVIGPGA